VSKPSSFKHPQLDPSTSVGIEALRMAYRMAARKSRDQRQHQYGCTALFFFLNSELNPSISVGIEALEVAYRYGSKKKQRSKAAPIGLHCPFYLSKKPTADSQHFCGGQGPWSGPYL
jgi:hypothetical protein